MTETKVRHTEASETFGNIAQHLEKLADIVKGIEQTIADVAVPEDHGTISRLQLLDYLRQSLFDLSYAMDAYSGASCSCKEVTADHAVWAKLKLRSSQDLFLSKSNRPSSSELEEGHVDLF